MRVQSILRKISFDLENNALSLSDDFETVGEVNLDCFDQKDVAKNITLLYKGRLLCWEFINQNELNAFISRDETVYVANITIHKEEK